MTVALPDLSVATVHLLARGKIRRYWGPPGTGKTWTLADELKRVVAERGPDSAAVVSFTHTSAAAIAGRDTGLPDTAVGTLHSLAYRAIGGRSVAEVALDRKSIQAWNSRVGLHWQLSDDARRGMVELAREGGSSKYGGDQLIGLYDLLRARFCPPMEWPPEVRRFAEAWTEYKRQSDTADFTDMCLLALARALDGESAPGNPQVLVGDEAQDFTPLETALLLAWGRSCDELFLALDDDQSINQWRGGDPAPILALGMGMDGEPQPDLVVVDKPLQQSYRVPAAAQRAALHWIEQVPPERRRAKVYRARTHNGQPDGDVVEGQIYHVSYPLEAIETAQAIARHTQAGRRTMVLASCQYMLNGVLSNLRELGVPYWNHYRPSERRWNPLSAGEGELSTAERLYRYLVMDADQLGDAARPWTGDDVRAWIDLVGATEAGLARGAKSARSLLPAGILPEALVYGLFADPDGEHCTRAVEPDIDWFSSVALASKRSVLQYPLAIARRFGPAALLEPDWSQPASPQHPQCVVGTIHSFKGAEADDVFVSPSISGAGYGQWVQGGAQRDELLRQFYVALTRARQTTIILSSTERHVPRELLCPPEMVRR